MAVNFSTESKNQLYLDKRKKTQSESSASFISITCKIRRRKLIQNNRKFENWHKCDDIFQLKHRYWMVQTENLWIRRDTSQYMQYEKCIIWKGIFIFCVFFFSLARPFGFAVFIQNSALSKIIDYNVYSLHWLWYNGNGAWRGALFLPFVWYTEFRSAYFLFVASFSPDIRLLLFVFVIIVYW